MVYFEKSQPAPACLESEKAKPSGTYRCGEVGDRLQVDFRNKCYLCESRGITAINVEHFRPHRGKNRDLEFDWNNLFFCCVHCNATKSDNPAYDVLLDCTSQADAPDSHIRFELNSGISALPSFMPITDSEKVRNTVQLLQEIHSGRSMIRKLEATNLVELIQRKLNKFYKKIDLWFDATGQEKEDLRQSIIAHLQNSSAFTAFKRWIIRDNPVLKAEFGETF